MSQTTVSDVNQLEIDENLVGGPMRDELVRFYNKLVYWTEQHSLWDSKKKRTENLLEEAKDKAKALRAQDAKEKDLKAKIQEAHIRDFWGVTVEVINTDTGEIIETTCSSLNEDYIEALQMESVTRHKMNLCTTALDIGRTCVSWDKNELVRMGGNV